MKTVRLKLPRPFEWQRQVMAEAKRFNVLSVGRRAGKTELGTILCATPEVLPQPVGWFSPSYKDMLEVWRSLSQRLSPIVARKSVAERRLEFTTGGVLEFWSLDNPQAGRGRKYQRVIVDEAAFVPTLYDSWSYAIRLTLADMGGDAWFMSTPKGRNGFWTLWQYGHDDQEPEWASWQMPSEVNPLLPREELAAMRRQLPERVARQELDAEFLDDAGGVFRRVMDAATATALDEMIGGRQYVMGIDWGRSNDFTVIAVVDMTTAALVYLDRFNQIDYTVQRGRVIAAYERFRPAQVIVEVNAMGQPVADELVRDGLPISGFTTTNASKARIIDNLALAFERGTIRILNDAILIGELQAYEMERTSGGLMRYGAPPGMHDDTVMALAMAWHGATDASDRVVKVTRYDKRPIPPA